MNSIRPKTKQLVTYYCGCHGDLVTIATRYVADAYCPKEPQYYCGCHGNLVTVATRYVAVPIVPRNLYAKYGLNMT